MGGGGVTAHTHYDSLHNLFAQLVGRKTFILSPPKEINKLYLYSSLHPSYRQSQVDFDAPNITMFPDFYNVSAIKVIAYCYEVVERPGDTRTWRYALSSSFLVS